MNTWQKKCKHSYDTWITQTVKWYRDKCAIVKAKRAMGKFFYLNLLTSSQPLQPLRSPWSTHLQQKRKRHVYPRFWEFRATIEILNLKKKRDYSASNVLSFFLKACKTHKWINDPYVLAYEALTVKSDIYFTVHRINLIWDLKAEKKKKKKKTYFQRIKNNSAISFPLKETFERDEKVPRIERYFNIAG